MNLVSLKWWTQNSDVLWKLLMVEFRFPWWKWWCACFRRRWRSGGIFLWWWTHDGAGLYEGFRFPHLHQRYKHTLPKYYLNVTRGLYCQSVVTGFLWHALVETHSALFSSVVWVVISLAIIQLLFFISIMLIFKINDQIIKVCSVFTQTLQWMPHPQYNLIC